MTTSKAPLRILLTALVALGLACLSLAAQTHRPVASHKAAAKITADQATKAALAKYPGKIVGKIALENEDGKWQYAVNVRSGKKLREVMVDAHSGKIASVEVTTAAEEAKEAAAEAKANHKTAGKKG